MESDRCDRKFSIASVSVYVQYPILFDRLGQAAELPNGLLQADAYDVGTTSRRGAAVTDLP